MAGNCKKSNAKDIKNSWQRQGFKEHIRFEKLLCDLSVTFVDLLSCIVYEDLDHGLELILDMDYRCNNLKYDIARYKQLEEIYGY